MSLRSSRLWKKVWQRRISRLSFQSNNLIRPGKTRLSWIKAYPRAVVGLFIGLIALIIFFSIVIAFFSKDLPRPDRIVRSEGFATKIFDRKGDLIYDVYKKEKRTPVDLNLVPLYLRQATIAIEDKDFYKHKGFDVRGWLRSIYLIIRYRRLAGGSTITQQLVKSVLLTSERTLPRKIKEFILALQIERKYSKDQILQMYLNEVPYGGTAFGVQEAAETYFGKNVSELNLIESAILAGLPQRPSYYSPFGNEPRAYISRTESVLRRMREDSYISSQQEKEANSLLKDFEFDQQKGTIRAPHFVMYLKKILEDRYGEKMVEEGGLRVYTTLDLEFQEEAQTFLSEEIAKVEKLHITNGAAVVIDPKTGEILAMIGSKNYDDPDYDGKVNVVTSLRQPGSAIKPVTYATALKKGYTLASLLLDVKTSFPGGDKPEYIPENYDGKEHGPLRMRVALGSSINIAAVKMLAKVGIRSMLETAFQMGISTLEPSSENLRRLGLSVTLGGGEVRLLEMVAAYSAFANNGLRVEPISILKVTDKDGNILEEYSDYPKKQVLTPEQAFLISNALSDNNARLLTFSENNALVIPNRMVAVKTGTTNDKRDNWTIGWTPQVIVGVWVGNNDNSAMKEVASGVSGAAPIWRKILLAYLNDKPAMDFEVPPNIVTQEVDQVSGFKSHDGFSSVVEYFVKGTEPQGEDPVHVKLKICRTADKLATPVDVARGEYDEKEYFVLKEEDPTAAPDGPNKWQEALDRWVNLQSDSRYHPPTESCSDQGQIEVRIIKPEDKSQVGNSFQIKIEPILNNEIIKIEILINDSLRETITGTPYERDITLPDGTYRLKIRVHDNKGNLGEKEIRIGVNFPWDYTAPTPSPILSLTPTVSLSP